MPIKNQNIAIAIIDNVERSKIINQDIVMMHRDQNLWYCYDAESKHPKSGIYCIQKFVNYLDFSAERLVQDAKTIKFVQFVELTAIFT